MDNKEKMETLSSYPSNSKKEAAAKMPKKFEKVVTGSVKKQKKGIGRKVTETFLEDDTSSVGNYIFWDVLIPAVKSMVCDMVGWGGMAEMLLFGSTKGTRTRRDGGKSYTNYGGYSSPGPGPARGHNDRTARELSRANRASHNFDDIVLETRGEAEEVLSHLVDQTIDYGEASVSDFYDLLGYESNFTDEKYGWYDLRDATVQRVRGGYLIRLPKTKLLD